MPSKHNKNNKKTSSLKGAVDYSLARPGDRQQWSEKASFVRDESLFFFTQPSWPGDKLGDLKIVSPPNFDCFFNSLFAFLRLYVVIIDGVQMSIEEQFVTLCSLIKEKYPQFIDEEPMMKIIDSLGIQVLSEVQLRTMHRNKALNRLDLSRPTLVTLRGDQFLQQNTGFGHVGFLVPTKKTKKISYEAFLGALTGRVSISVVPAVNMKKLPSQKPVTKVYVQAKKKAKEVDVQKKRFFYALRHLGADAKPDSSESLVEQKEWAFSLMKMCRLGIPTNWSQLPRTVSSKLSEYIISFFFKSRSETYWQKQGEKSVQVYKSKVKWGYVPQLLTLGSVLILFSTFVSRWMMIKILVLSAYFLWMFNYMQYEVGNRCYVILGFSILFVGLIKRRLYFIWTGVSISLCGLLILQLTQKVVFENVQANVARQAGAVQAGVKYVIQFMLNGYNSGNVALTAVKNQFGDYYSPHYLDLVRERPDYYVYQPLDTAWLWDQNGLGLSNWFFGLFPTQGEIFNFVLGRKAISQAPFKDFLDFFFVSEWDHKISDLCDHGSIFSDESWSCRVSTVVSGYWNAWVINEWYPGFLVSWKTVLYVFLYRVLIDYKNQRLVILGFVPKLINVAAFERIKRQSFPHLYRPQQVRGKSDSNPFGGIKVIRTRGGKSIVHNPVGVIDQQFNSVLNSYGWGFTAKQINESTHYSGGHANMRAAVDALQADALSRVLTHCLHLADGQRQFDIIDVGAKFSKISRVIDQAFNLTGEEVFKLKKPEELVAAFQRDNYNRILTAHREAITAWNLDPLVFNSGADYMNAIGAFGGRHVNIIQGGVARQMQLCQFCEVIPVDVVTQYSRLIGCVTYSPVRPQEVNNDYDQNYYMKQLSQYNLARVNQRGVRLNRVAVSKIQAYRARRNVRDDDRFYLLFDSHYYLQQWKPTQHGRVLLVGGDFMSLIGTYKLPLGEGSYKVYRHKSTHKAMMRMVCSSSGTFYKHPLVHVENAELRMDYGWYSHIMHDCSTRNLKIRGIMLPRLDEALQQRLQQTSVQATWIHDFVKSTEVSARTVTKYSTYDIQLWSPLRAPTVEKVYFQRSQWNDAKLFLSLVHDFSFSPSVLLKRCLGGFCGQLLLFLRFFINQIVIMSENGDKHVTKNVINLIPFVRKQMTKIVQPEDLRSQRMRFGYVPNAADIQLRGGRCTPDVLQKCIEADIPKGKKVKGYSGQMSSDWLQTKCVFYSKPCPPVNEVSRHLIRDDPEAIAASDDTVRRVNKLLSEVPQDMDIKKGQLVERVIQSKVVPTGYSFLSGVNEFEWSSKSILNSIYAVYHRHLSCKLLPQVAEVRRFNAMTDRYISQLAKKVVSSLMEDPQWDPIQAIKQKTDFNREKKILYYTQCIDALQSGKVQMGTFLTMVKSGEVQYETNPLQVVNNFLHGQSSRPRNINRPSKALCGVLTLLQSKLWKPLKKGEKGFIQGLTKQQLLQALMNGVGDHWKVVCIDGSSFDSTQSAQMMQAVDDKFWLAIKPGLLQVLKTLKMNSPDVFQGDPQALLESLYKQILEPMNVCFTNLPGIEPAVWPQHIWVKWQKSWGTQVAKGNDRDFVQSNYIYNQINGTTFSGHPTKTTLGNTLRSLCYAYYYLERAGIKDAWDNPRVHVCAAGDDVIIFCQPELETKIRDTILQYTARGEEGTIGLGQRVKQVITGGLRDIDFCSKWSFGDSVNGLNLTRDVNKVLNTRQFYGKQNGDIVSHPGLHAKAIYEGFKTDKVSHLIQDILQVRMNYYGLALPKNRQINTEALKKLSDRYRVVFSSKAKGYQNEAEVNAKCGVNSTVLYRLMLSFEYSPLTYISQEGKVKYGFVAPEATNAESNVDSMGRMELCHFSSVRRIRVRLYPKSRQNKRSIALRARVLTRVAAINSADEPKSQSLMEKRFVLVNVNHSCSVMHNVLWTPGISGGCKTPSNDDCCCRH